MSERYTPVEPLTYNDYEIDKYTEDKERPFPLKGSKYHTISRHHGRSLERSEIDNGVIWAKKFGRYSILFGAASEKGVPFQKPELFSDKYNFSGIGAKGLVTNQGLIRSMKVSDFVNSHGLPTECFRSIRSLESITIDGRTFEGNELKEYLFRELETKVKNLSLNLQLSDIEVGEVMEPTKEFLEQHQFYTVERDYQVGERFRDMDAILDSKEHTIEVFNKIFRWLNIVRDLESKNPDTYSCLEEPKEFEGYTFKPTDADLLKYFVLYLPKKMGQYLGRFHSLKLTHGFASSHNWSLVGTLYDMDGARGKFIDNTDPSEDKVIQDLEQSFVALVNHLMLTAKPNYISELIERTCGSQGVTLVRTEFCEAYKKYSPGTTKEKERIIELAELKAFK